MVLVACGTAPEPQRPVVPPPQEDTCMAAPYARLIGLDQTTLERELILRQVRVIRPGDFVTQDFRPMRLNFEIDNDGRIARIFCG